MAKRPIKMELKGFGMFMIVLVFLLGGILWGVWHLVATYISPTMARLWALVATALLPVIGVASYRLGQNESRGVMYGIDAGIERVGKAAAQAIDMRASQARVIREVRQATPAAYTVELPRPEPAITVRPQLQSGEPVDL